MRFIGKYKILGLLGRGGMARVYKVLDPENDQLLSLKLLWPQSILSSQLGQEEIKRRFLAEAKTMQALEHPNIARVIEWGQDCELTYMVQEYLCLNLSLLLGEEREIELPSRPISPLKALQISNQTLLGLHNLHHAGIVHRDIKPANIMLNLQEEVRIIDLGLSKLRGEVQQHPQGMLVGSPYYAAPEQLDNPDLADPRADLYSLGVVLYRMITGRLPDNSSWPSPGKDDLLGRQWTAFVHKALAPDPGQRFATALEMQQALLGLEDEWSTRRNEICSMPEPRLYSWYPGGKPLRKEPLFTGSTRAAFEPLLDRLLQPQGYLENDFHILDQSILDAATGLIWGYHVSRTPLTQDEALHFAASQETTDLPWRLPTLEELLSLLQPRQSLEQVCAPPLEQLEGISRVWSSDRQTKSKGWILDLEQGAAMAQDRMCRFQVIPVRDAER
jgi:serine/threonine-protein kinase